jgi:hypothetical protein
MEAARRLQSTQVDAFGATSGKSPRERNSMQRSGASTTAAAIWTRLLRPEEEDMSPEAARFFLKLAFAPQDLDRMHTLTVRNQAGELTAAELEELKAYRQIGLEIDLLRAKARCALKNSHAGH